MAAVVEQLSAALSDRYRIERELGRGGMATVYLAEDLKHRRSVAIKVLDPELAALTGPERFLREIEVAARLQHPHILPLLDSGRAGDLLYYVMPYVEGESLRARLDRERQLPVKDARRLAEDVASALDYAHRQGVVHRDIKPENVLLVDGHAVVADFGIARAIAEAGGSKLTETGVTLGTPIYMSPEQVVGSGALDGRSDLYSLACVVYEMLGGQPPFTGATGESLAHQHLNVAPRRVSELRTAVPEKVDRALATALSKAAADRFATAAEFAAAITGEMEAAAAPEPPAARVRVPSRRRGVAIGAGVALLVIVAIAVATQSGLFSRWFGRTGLASNAKKEWILIADFEGPPDDSSLAVTVRDLVCGALDQSEIVAVVPRDQMRVALRNAGRPASTRVTPEVARELAYRKAVRAVLEGKIGRLGQGYSVVLRVVNADSFKVLLTESVTARDQDALIPALGRLAMRLRAGLGERRSAIQATRSEFSEVMTPSFDAYRLFVTGLDMEARMQYREQIAVDRDALALDPDFALAWLGQGVALGNLGHQDSAIIAYDEALRRPDRLTSIQRLFIQALRASAAGDPRGALAAYDHLLQYNPSDPRALNNRAVELDDLGRVEEALLSLRKSEQESPFGPGQGHRLNEITYLCELGRFDESRPIVRHLPPPQRELARMAIENSATNWAESERIGDSLLSDRALDQDSRCIALLQLASARAARGALGAALRAYEQAEVTAPGTMAPQRYEYAARLARMMLAEVSAGAIPVPSDVRSSDSSVRSLLARGLRASMERDGASAKLLLDAARSRPRSETNYLEYQIALLAARVAAMDGRWSEAVDSLRSVASRHPSAGKLYYLGGAMAARWFLADAFEKLDRPDSAAVHLEMALSDFEGSYWETHLRGIAVPFIHRRLVLLYARTGRVEGARRHWQRFSETFRTPDPEIRPMIEEAREALATAEGIVRSTRR